MVSEVDGNEDLPVLKKENLTQVKFQQGVEAIVTFPPYFKNQFHFHKVASSDFQINFLKIFYALTCFRNGAHFYATKMDHIDCYDEK